MKIICFEPFPEVNSETTFDDVWFINIEVILKQT